MSTEKDNDDVRSTTETLDPEVIEALNQADPEDVKAALGGGGKLTRRAALGIAGGVGAAAVGGTAGAATSSSGTAGSMAVGGVTTNTYKFANPNYFGGPASARTELNSELTSEDAGAKYRADDTGAVYHWTGSSWTLLPGKFESVDTEDLHSKDRLSKFVLRKSSGGTVYANAQRDGLVTSSFSSADAALQHALDEINNNGGRIQVSIDAPRMTSSVDVTNKVDSLTIQGQSYRGTTFQLADGVNAPMFVWDGNSGSGQDYGFALLDAKFHGNKANNTSGAGFEVKNTTTTARLRDVWMERVFFDSFAGHGITTASVWGWRLYHMFSERNGGRGLDTRGLGTNLRAVQCKFLHNDGINVFINRPKMTFISCNADDGNDDGFWVAGSGSDHAQLIGCRATGNPNKDLNIRNGPTWVLGGSFGSVSLGGNATDVRLNASPEFSSFTPGGTRTRWNDVIGSGPIGGVDLSTTTGQWEGDRAMSSGATANTGDTAYSYWTWDSTNSVWTDQDGNTV